MPDVTFVNLLAVVVIGFLAPLALGLTPALRLPAVVLEIVLGIVVGPHGFGWVAVDLPVQVLSVVGLAFLLFLAGLEIEVNRLRGRLLRTALLGFAVSFGLALVVGIGLDAVGLAEAPLLIAIVLTATSLGVVVPVLKDAGEAGTGFGQLVIAGATVADFGAVILLSLFFSREATGTSTKLVLLGGFVLTVIAVGFGIARAEHSMRLSATLRRLQDTTAQIRVRGAFLLLIAFVALARKLGLEVLLGAFLAGVMLSAVDRDRLMTHPRFRLKLDAAGFGVFIPVFFVTSGLTFDLGALFGSASAIARVPVFLAALLVARGLPALLYRSEAGPTKTAAAALLQATSLPFIVAATQIGMELGELGAATGAAFVAAGLLSVLLFPLGAVTLLRSGERTSGIATGARNGGIIVAAQGQG